MASGTEVPRVALGTQGLVVSAQGLGCMGMSVAYGEPKPDEEMIQLIRYAVDSGITFLDTADMYGPYTNEVLVGKGIAGIRDKVQLATKFGITATVSPEGEWIMTYRGDPEYVRNCCEASLKRLNVDCIDLYYQHRVDAKVPIEITIGEMKKLVEEGKVKYIGLSEASASDIRRAHAVHPITAVQIEWSLWSRVAEKEIIPTCRELGIGIVCYSPLGRGFFTGVAAISLSDMDFRKSSQPRFQQENYEKNQVFYNRLVEIGKTRNKTAGQIALAWLQHQGADVVPIPGTTKVHNLNQNIGALGVQLSKEELAEIEAAVPVDEIAGDRYDATMQNSWDHDSPPLSSWTGVRP